MVMCETRYRADAGVPQPRSASSWWRRVLPCGQAGQSRVAACLLWLVLACLLPATLGAGFALWSSYQDGRAALLEHAKLNARAMSRTVDAVLGNAMAGMQALATSPALLRGDLAAFADQAHRVLPYQAGNNVVLSDTSGQQWVNTLIPYGQPLPMHGNLEFQARVIKSGKAAVSDLFVGGLLRRPLVAVEVPVFQAEQVRYSLAMGFLPERFAAILAEQRPEPSWIVSIFDSKGTIVARTHDAERFVGHQGAPALVAALAQAAEGVVETQTLEGVPVFAVYTRSTATGWSAAVGIPKHALLAQLQRWTMWLALSAAALILVGMMAARVIAGRIASDIAALIEPANALGEGRAVTVAPTATKEVTAVALALARAANLLHTRTLQRDVATHAARHDALTDLSNRANFAELLNQRLLACAQNRGRLSVLFVDIDGFKPVNDQHGHAVGDELLRAFATRLRAGVREGDVVARFGGDEFAVLIDGHLPGEIEALMQHLVERLSRPYAIRDITIHVSASVGAAGFPDDGRTTEALLEAADAAMYRVKQGGKRRSAESEHGSL